MDEYYMYCSPVDLLLGDVRPVDLLGSHVDVQSHCVLQTRNDACVLTLVQCHLPHLMAIGEEQEGYCPF